MLCFCAIFCVIRGKPLFCVLACIFVFSNKVPSKVLCVCSLFVEIFKEVAREVGIFFVHVLPEVPIIARENVMGIMLSFVCCCPLP